MVENFDKWDQQEIHKDKEDAKKNKDDRKEFKQALKTRRKEFREKIKAEGSKHKTKCKDSLRERFRNPLTANERRRYRTKVLPGELRTDVVQAMAPPNSKVYQDNWNGRWSISMGGYLRSRSWLRYGHTDSAYLALWKMWARFMELYGLEECPIPGLKELAAEIEKKSKEAALAEAAEVPDPDAIINGPPPGGYAAASSTGPMVPLADAGGG